MKLNLNITYKEYISNKTLKTDTDNIANDLTNLQLEYYDSDKFGFLINSEITKRLEKVFEIVIPQTQLDKYNKLSNNKKRLVLAQGVFGAFRNKLVLDKTGLSKKSPDKTYYAELKIAGWDLLKQMYLAMIDKIIVDKNTNQITIK